MFMCKLMTSTMRTERIIETWVELPFVPFVGLIYDWGYSEEKIVEVTWNQPGHSFLVMLSEVSEEAGDELIASGWVENK